jgi:hypothetical protein
LLGLIDDAHASSPHFAEDTEVAQRGRRTWEIPRRRLAWLNPFGLAEIGSGHVDELQGRQAPRQRILDLRVTGQQLVPIRSVAGFQSGAVFLQGLNETRIV